MYGRLFGPTRPLILSISLLSIVLMLFSFTQVDLNFTFSRFTYIQKLVRDLQWWGYYARPWATGFYLALLAGWFGLYTYILRQCDKKLIPTRGFWWMVAIITGVAVWSYPAFSYDIFNYLFTAKTVIFYAKNPYELIPQTLMGFDPWISVMRWIHQPSAYTPLWILFTLPIYILSFGYLIPAIYLIKIALAGVYLATIWYIGKIAQRNRQNEILAMSIFAFNPLIIFETLVSGHNDILMMLFAIMAIWYWDKKEKLKAWWWLSVSIATKLVTIGIVPMFLGMKRKWILGMMLCILGLVILKREILPWYWVWIMPFVALTPEDKKIIGLGWGMSLGLLLRYAPFFYYGNWDPPVPVLMFWLTVIPIFALGALWIGRSWGRVVKKKV